MGLIIDNFAGGGGASTGIEAALGRSIDVAINHDPAALAMHRANHPAAHHYCESVWQVDPREVTRGRPVDLGWFSPDCKHFSKAKGGRPVEKGIRGLAWVAVKWADRVRPRVIMLENVEEFRDWGPLVVAENGALMPCPNRKGRTFNSWCAALRRLGYRVEHEELRACDYGAPTKRKRLFVVARCDGGRIEWPDPTHGPGRIPYRTAAECIDWSIPCPSIFGRARPLADATMARIAKGVKRYVIDAADPFIVPITHTGAPRVHPIDEPLRTITTASRGELALIVPHVTKFRSGSVGHDVGEPFHTITANAFVKRPGGAPSMGVVAAFLAQHNSGMVGHDARKPLSTVVGKGCTQAVVASSLVKLFGTCRDGQPVTEPMPTVTAGGWHVAEVRAFMVKYFGTAIGASFHDPLHTISTRDRFGVVTVQIGGEPWAIVDIGMRMLTPRELFRAQGFAEDYIIAPEFEGKPLTKTAQIRMCGNSVCPPVAEALVRANLADAAAARAA